MHRYRIDRSLQIIACLLEEARIVKVLYMLLALSIEEAQLLLVVSVHVFVYFAATRLVYDMLVLSCLRTSTLLAYLSDDFLYLEAFD